MKSIAVAAAILLASSAAFASTPEEDAAATFISSNIKLALNQTLQALRQDGIQLDSATVMAKVMEQLPLAYDQKAHYAAAEILREATAPKLNIDAAEFINTAKNRPGAVVTPEGVVIETLKPGDGAMPVGTSTVSMRYVGKLPGGQIFDQIGPDEAPMDGRVLDFTPGFSIGLQQMKAGGKYRLTIPAELAYGQNGVPGVIPPSCPLEFEVELVAVK